MTCVPMRQDWNPKDTTLDRDKSTIASKYRGLLADISAADLEKYTSSGHEVIDCTSTRRTTRD